MQEKASITAQPPTPPYEGALSLFSLLFFVRFFRKLGSNLNLMSLFLS